MQGVHFPHFYMKLGILLKIVEVFTFFPSEVMTDFGVKFIMALLVLNLQKAHLVSPSCLKLLKGSTNLDRVFFVDFCRVVSFFFKYFVFQISTKLIIFH